MTDAARARTAPTRTGVPKPGDRGLDVSAAIQGFSRTLCRGAMSFGGLSTHALMLFTRPVLEQRRQSSLRPIVIVFGPQVASLRCSIHQPFTSATADFFPRQLGHGDSE